MARCSFTKYGDDEFVLRLNREEALKLAAIVGRSAHDSRLFDNDDERQGERYEEIINQLHQGQPGEFVNSYNLTDTNGGQLPTYELVKCG